MCPANDKILSLTKVLFYICLCSWRYVQACLHCLCCHHAVKSSKYFARPLRKQITLFCVAFYVKGYPDIICLMMAIGFNVFSPVLLALPCVLCALNVNCLMHCPLSVTLIRYSIDWGAEQMRCGS